MLEVLRRHPIPIAAHFDEVFVLTYAFPEQILNSMLSPGLELDTYRSFGFLAIALVRTRRLRPAGLPEWCGRDFVLSGYRIFSRYRRPNGQILRGLKILRSDTDSKVMCTIGNALTRYGYEHARVNWTHQGSQLVIDVETPGGASDLSVSAEIGKDASLPQGSPFSDMETARRFAGPLPYTFTYEKKSNSLLVVQGVREEWHPRPVAVDVRRCEFVRRPPFAPAPPLLASAFYMTDIPYRWETGTLEKIV